MVKINIILAFILISNSSLADICITTFEQDTASSDIIFVGKLIETKYGSYWQDGYPVSIYTFEIKESFKGLSQWRTVTSVMSPVNGCCSPHFKMDSVFLVSATAFGKNSNVYWTNDCKLNGLLSKNREVYNRLGNWYKPASTSEDLELFKERKAWLLEEEQRETDSLNQLQTSLKLNLESERRKNGLLTIGVALLTLTSVLLLAMNLRRKGSSN